MNTSFQISNIYSSSLSAPPKIPKYEEHGPQTAEGQLMSMERSIMNALQMINVGTDIISLNDERNTGCFRSLANNEMLVVLELLYLQYRTSLWQTLQESADTASLRTRALLNYRDQFISLIDSVRAVKMTKMSKLLEYFFCSAPNEFDFHQIMEDIEQNDGDELDYYRPNQSLYLSRIVQLFPRTEQISISGKNWDWSLDLFIQFLDSYDLDSNGLALQYIDIKMDMMEAQEKLMENETSHNINRLRQMGWRFISPTTLYRVGLRPEPRKPFLRTFTELKYGDDANYRRNTVKLFVSASMKLVLNSTPGIRRSIANHQRVGSRESSIDDDVDMKQETIDDAHSAEQRMNDNVYNEGGAKYKEIDYDPSSCTLSRQIFDILEYKEDLVQMLKCRVNTVDDAYESDKRREAIFASECGKVEVLVLDPMPSELRPIFYDQGHGARALLSFDMIIRVFPRAKVVFVTSTTFNLRICIHFVKFINGLDSDEFIDLKKVYFSKAQPLRHRDIGGVQWRLKEIGWQFVESKQVLRVIE